jgi:LacI family transcriptional regulator
MMRRTTIKDVAEKAGVSIGTVSAVLNRRDSVRSVTRKRVLSVMDTLNYRPVEAARRRLGTPREKTLGLVVKEIHNPYFADIIVGAQEEARKHDYQLLVMSSEQVFEREVDAVNALVAKDIDGLIINPLIEQGAHDAQGTEGEKGTEATQAAHFRDLEANNIPFVTIEGDAGDVASVVDIDNEQGAFDAAMHLLSLGHTDIVHLAGPAYSQHAIERRAGVLRAAPVARIVHAGATLEDGFNAVRDQLEGSCCTALICYNDLVAIGAMRGLLNQGKRIPEDVSVVGFDDIDVSSYLSVPLTTVRIPKREMGRRAAAIAIEQIEHPAPPPAIHSPAAPATPIQSSTPSRSQRVVLDAELIVRSSTSPVKTV